MHGAPKNSNHYKNCSIYVVFWWFLLHQGKKRLGRYTPNCIISEVSLNKAACKVLQQWRFDFFLCWGIPLATGGPNWASLPQNAINSHLGCIKNLNASGEPCFFRRWQEITNFLHLRLSIGHVGTKLCRHGLNFNHFRRLKKNIKL